MYREFFQKKPTSFPNNIKVKIQKNKVAINKEDKCFIFLLMMRNIKNNINKILYISPLSKLNKTDKTLNGARTKINLINFDLSIKK